jgi:hypothetical protein
MACIGVTSLVRDYAPRYGGLGDRQHQLEVHRANY